MMMTIICSLVGFKIAAFPIILLYIVQVSEIPPSLVFEHSVMGYPQAVGVREAPINLALLNNFCLVMFIVGVLYRYCFCSILGTYINQSFL